MDNRNGKRYQWPILLLLFFLSFLSSNTLAQAPGTAPVKISTETQVLHGRKYFVHIVEKGQTVYSISKAYKVESYDAVTHVDIHFLHPGDTVWLPARGQFSSGTDALDAQKQEAIRRQQEESNKKKEPTESNKPGSVLSPYEPMGQGDKKNSERAESPEHPENTEEPVCSEKKRQGDPHVGDDAAASRPD